MPGRCSPKYPSGSMGSLLRFLASPIWVIVLLLPTASASPRCADLSAQVVLKAPLAFCAYNGSACCDASADSAVQKQFSSMNISDADCASAVKAVICAKCDPFSANLFRPKVRSIPVLCNSSISSDTVPSRSSLVSFCKLLWNSCKNVSILNSPFSPSLRKGNSSKLVDLWQSEDNFCSYYGGSSANGSACFDGKSTQLNDTQNPPPKGLCLERIDNGSYLNMVAHPDGSNRVFLSNQEGKIWLATLPEAGSGKMLEVNESNPFLDLSDVVYSDAELGMMGMAFHPKFTTNGRFFVSYNCDKSQSRNCAGKCSCNSEVGCDPAKLATEYMGGLSHPCQYHSVIAEFEAESSSTPSMAFSANPTELSRIFTMGLPFTSHHGGQILFGPEDGYLYFMMGDGGGTNDPNNFAQNKQSLLGKIMRFNVDKTPSSKQINDLALWGNYTIPEDNPYNGDKMFRPEIWASGLRNPWRCSFDAYRPSYFFCADVGQDAFEEVDLVSKGGNYGWRVYEGPYILNSTNVNLSSLNVIFPVMGYNHSELTETSAKSASITGGYVYRSETDPCMFGRYLYADLYAKYMWAGTEIPVNSGVFDSTLISFNCSKDSPIPCEYLTDGSPALKFIFSFGEDNNKDVYVLAANGLYKIAPPSHCNYTCPIERPSASINPPPSPSSSSSTTRSGYYAKFMVFFSILLLAAITFIF